MRTVIFLRQTKKLRHEPTERRTLMPENQHSPEAAKMADDIARYRGQPTTSEIALTEQGAHEARCSVAAGSASAMRCTVCNQLLNERRRSGLCADCIIEGQEADNRELRSRQRPWMLGESYDLRAENDRLRGSLRAIAAAERKPSGELRCMARRALEPNVISQTRRGEAPELSVMIWIALFFIGN